VEKGETPGIKMNGRDARQEMRVALKESHLGLRNSTTRIPFRYGIAVLTRCPQAIVRVTIECDGRLCHGYSGDCLPPSWFDKSAGKDFARQIDDMLRVIAMAQSVYETGFDREAPFFPTWLTCEAQIQQRCHEWELPPLLASFGSSLLERAILDAACRRHDVSFAHAVRRNLFGLDAGLVHRELQCASPAEWLPAEPALSIYVRQTVGLGDPLTLDEIPPADRLHDGWPQAIEDYAVRRRVRYYKVKVSNCLDRDIQRLAGIASLLERHLGQDYQLTLDGNEQYKRAEDFEELVGEIRRRPELAALWRNVLAIEQPFDRGIALEPGHIGALRELSRVKPVIIDESDGTLDAYPRAIDLGYRGVSSKNCKGAIRSLLNAGLTWLHNDRGRLDDYTMTGEDLCSVGIVPTQSDLCLAATLGLPHVERNGHHYHPGLSYLPEPTRRAALSAHGDFYVEEHGIIGPRISDGRFQIASLQCAGFGFAVEPDMSAMESAETWKFESLYNS
jgi:hypothetical protein